MTIKPMPLEEWQKYIGNYINKTCTEIDYLRHRVDVLEQEVIELGGHKRNFWWRFRSGVNYGYRGQEGKK